MAVIEMGANHPGEIRASALLADPDYGLITNVGKAHLEGFGSPENILATKTELYEYIRQKGGKIFVNLDHSNLVKKSQGIQRLAYSSREGEAPVLVSGRTAESSAFLGVEWTDQRYRKRYIVQSRLIGAYNLENLLAAICIGLYFDVPPAVSTRLWKITSLPTTALNGSKRQTTGLSLMPTMPIPQHESRFGSISKPTLRVAELLF